MAQPDNGHFNRLNYPCQASSLCGYALFWLVVFFALPSFSWRITESYYNKKREELRAKQKGIFDKISRLGFADEEYYLTSEYLLQLANRAYDLFISSEAKEKRQLLKLTLQNLKFRGQKG